MACLTAPPPIELPEDACTSESVVVSGHDASLASERKGWRVLRTAENGAKAQRLVVALPSPARKPTQLSAASLYEHDELSDLRT